MTRGAPPQPQPSPQAPGRRLPGPPAGRAMTARTPFHLPVAGIFASSI